jgi:hypothetical protein
MWTWFTEDSLLPLVTGTFLCLAFLALAITHYNRAMLLIALAIGVATATIVVVETWVVTDREAIQSLVRSLAKALESKDMEQIVAAISDKRKTIRERACQEMDNYSVNSCRIVDFTDFKLDDSSTPRTAEISFVVIAQGNDRHLNRGTVHERVTLFIESNDSGDWKIIDYSHEYARAGGRL